MNTKERVVEKIKDVLHSEFGIPLTEMKPRAHLYKDLGLDSIDAIDLVVRLEVETGLKLKAAELKSLRRFQDIVDVVWARIHDKRLPLRK